MDNINLTCARQKLNSATTTEELGRMSASSLTFADVPDEEEVPCEPVRHDWAGLKWLIEEGWPESLEEKELPEQLQSCLPELDPKGGPHVIFEQPMERDRAESSCICILAGNAPPFSLGARNSRFDWKSGSGVFSFLVSGNRDMRSEPCVQPSENDLCNFWARHLGFAF